MLHPLRPRLFLATAALVLLAVVASACTRTSTQAARSPSADPHPGYRLVFSDEFDGDKLDAKKWRTEMRWGSNTTGDLEHYAPGNVTVADGKLQLTARKEQADDRQYTSGVIASFDSYSFKYGYAEIRARTTSGAGLFPAFWLTPQDPDASGEIDVMEQLGQDPTRTYMTYHYRDGDKKGKFHQWYDGADFSKDFHTYAVEWSPGLLVWYVDGVERMRTADKHVADVPMYVIADLAIGGTWAGPPDQDTSFPATYEVDYIRVYQRP